MAVQANYILPHALMISLLPRIEANQMRKVPAPSRSRGRDLNMNGTVLPIQGKRTSFKVLPYPHTSPNYREHDQGFFVLPALFLESRHVPFHQSHLLRGLLLKMDWPKVSHDLPVAKETSPQIQRFSDTCVSPSSQVLAFHTVLAKPPESR